MAEDSDTTTLDMAIRNWSVVTVDHLSVLTETQ
jgi:hypothetical protein